MSNSKYQEALKFFTRLSHRIPLKFANDEFCKEYDKSLALIKELVDEATWIPVEKGLPDDRQVVLTIKNKHISILEYHADTKHWFETRGNWWWSYNMVDAWMPLPKPYLGSER